MSDPYAVSPLAGPLDAVVEVPGSKSITNRALACASLATGTSHLRGALLADDTEAMIGAMSGLGARIDIDTSGPDIEVHGTGGKLTTGPLDIDARLSGTTARFVLPVLALGSGTYSLDGAPSLRARPLGDGIAAVRALGCDVAERGEPGHLPVIVTPGALRSERIVVRGDTSSQFLSGLLMAAPCMGSAMTIQIDGALVSERYVAMTIAVMEAFGARVARDGEDGFDIAPGGYVSAQIDIEPDASAASYFFAAAAICGGRVRIEGLGRDSSQGDLAFVDVLGRMGARVSIGEHATEVEGTGELRGIEVDMSAISDTAQTLAAVAAFADGPTEMTGIGFIRAKETDRIAATVAELRRCGIGATETDDGMVIEPATPRPALVRTYDDHRMAMSFSLLGLKVAGIEIDDPGCVAKTFPDFFDVLERLG